MLTWPFLGLIKMTLTMTKYLENLPIDSTLTLLSMVKYFSFFEIGMILKMKPS